MKARVFYAVMALVMVLSLVAVAAVDAPGPPVAAQGDMWYVATTGNDTTGDGSAGYPWRTIQHAIGDGNVTAGDTINVASGTYDEGIIEVTKNLTITGATTPSKPIINPTTDTGDTYNVIGLTGRGWFQIHSGATVDFENLIFDGNGKAIYIAILYHEGGGTVKNCDFKNIQYQPTPYKGRGISNYGGYVEVLDSTFTNIQRIGVFTANPTVETLIKGCTYTGKGAGDWLDYGFEVGTTGSITVEDCTVTNCKGVASSDDSISAGILITDYFGPTPQATIKDSDIYNNSHGVWVGYGDTGTSTATLTNNNIYNNDSGVVVRSDGTTVIGHYNNIYGNGDYGVEVVSGSTPHDFESNWWGDASGPYDPTGTVEVPPCTDDPTTEVNADGVGDEVSDNVDYCPWLGHEAGIVYIEGVPEVHYPSIQAAIDAVTGTTILVGPGYYHEQLFIDQSMTITSVDGADVTIIDGTGLEGRSLEVEWYPGNTTTIYPVVWIDAAEVVFGAADQGFTITGATVYEPREGEPEPPPFEMGVGMLNRAAGCTIEDNIFDGNTVAGYMGMYEFGHSNNHILDNEFCGNVMALWLMGGGSETISGNTFIENYLAIGLQMSNDNDIVGITLNLNWEGIEVSGSHGNTISGNDISDTTGGEWLGMPIDGVAIELKDGCNENTISGNIIHNRVEFGAEWGIRLTGSSNNDIVGSNDISDCKYDGILLQGGSNENLVQGNTVNGSGSNGIALWESDNNDVLGNEVYDCGTGIDLNWGEGSGNKIGGTGAGEGNTIYDCGQGVRVANSWDEMVVGNTAYNCTYGIHLENSHNITVADNFVLEEGSLEDGNTEGILLENSWENTIRGNEICHNTDKGLHLDAGSHRNSVTDNKIHYNGHGMWIEGDENFICGNDIRHNTGEIDSGVHLTAAADNNQIHCNNIVGNTVRDGGDILSYGMFKEGGNATNAQNNWWGDEYGPGGDGPGSGDAVGGPVNFSDWAQTPFDFPDTTAPVIVDTAAVSDTISLLDTEFLWWVMGGAPYSIGPSYTDLIVDTGCLPCEACGVRVDLSALLLGMLPEDIGETVAGWEQWKRDEWYNWLNELANTQMNPYYYWDEEAEQECYFWDYELHLDWLLGPLEGYFGYEELMDMVFNGFRLGEFELPVTAFDCSGNENTDQHITLAIVDFQLPMDKGWNIRSTPISLDNSSLYSIVHLGDGLNYSSILRWNAEQKRWEQYAEPPSVYYAGWYYGSTKVADAVVKPLEAYYIKLNENDQLGLIIDRDMTGPPARQLYVGWNLVGLAPDIVDNGFNGMPSILALISAYIAEGELLPGFVIAMSIGEELGYAEEFYYNDIPLEKPWYWKEFHQEAWTVVPLLVEPEWMTPGGGYWLFMENNDRLAGFSYTPLPWRYIVPPL